MRLLLIAFLLSCFLSCRKEDPVIDINEFIDKYLICDSIRTTVDGTETVTIKGLGTGLDIQFDTARVYTIYSAPEQKFRYRIINPRIYYWLKSGNMHEGNYLKIKSKEGKHLLLEQKDLIAGKIDLYYYTSE